MNDLELNRFVYGVRQLVTAQVSNTFVFSVLVLLNLLFPLQFIVVVIKRHPLSDKNIFTCFSITMMTNSPKKQTKYPKNNPCHKARNISERKCDKFLFPRKRRRLKKYLQPRTVQNALNGWYGIT